MNRPADVRDRLLLVAGKLFVQRGYDGVSVRDITARARANLGAITYHFGSKQALYHAAIERIAAPLLAAVERIAHEPGRGLDRAEAIVRAFMAQDPGAPTALLRELASDRPLPPPIAQVMKRNFGVLVAAIRAGQADGSIRAGEPFELGLAVVSQLFFFRVAGRIIREVLGIDKRDPKGRARLIDHVAANVRHALAPAGRGHT